MKLFIRIYLVLLALVLASCGGGGGNPGTCSASAQLCAGDSAAQPAPVVVAGLFSKSGSGDTVFDLPSSVTRIRIQASFTGTSTNFMVKVAGSMIVNELLGTSWGPLTFEGTYLLARGGVVEITNSSGVEWRFTEVR